MRTLLAVTFACTVGVILALGLVRWGPHNAGVTVAIICGALIVIECANAVRKTRSRR